MKEQYYLISQLPDISVSGEKSTLPITEKYFKDLCLRFVGNKEASIIENLSLEPPKKEVKTGSSFLDAWYNHERCLRYALAQIRVSCTADIIQAARTAVGMDSPLSAEQFLYEYRLSVLSNLQPLDIFSIDAVYAYGIKLLLVQRMKMFNREKGTDSYHKIYDTILGETI